MERIRWARKPFYRFTNNLFVIVAEDDNGKPDQPQAFITPPSVGVNYHRNIWHGVLTPFLGSSLFAVDRIGGKNLEEFWFQEEI